MPELVQVGAVPRDFQRGRRLDQGKGLEDLLKTFLRGGAADRQDSPLGRRSRGAVMSGEAGIGMEHLHPVRADAGRNGHVPNVAARHQEAVKPVRRLLVPPHVAPNPERGVGPPGHAELGVGLPEAEGVEGLGADPVPGPGEPPPGRAGEAEAEGVADRGGPLGRGRP